jgi:hypothetical protein
MENNKKELRHKYKHLGNPFLKNTLQEMSLAIANKSSSLPSYGIKLIFMCFTNN